MAFKTEKKQHLGVLSYITSFHPYKHFKAVSHLQPQPEPRTSCQAALQSHIQDGANGKKLSSPHKM